MTWPANFTSKVVNGRLLTGLVFLHDAKKYYIFITLSDIVCKMSLDKISQSYILLILKKWGQLVDHFCPHTLYIYAMKNSRTEIRFIDRYLYNRKFPHNLLAEGVTKLPSIFYSNPII